MIGPETALERVHRAVWGMLYADDACIVSRTPQGLERMMANLVDVSGAFGLTVSQKKTETMSLPDPTCARSSDRAQRNGVNDTARPRPSST